MDLATKIGAPVIGRRFSMWGKTGKIMGVVRDFHFKPLHHPIEPLILLINRSSPQYLLIRYQQGRMKEALGSLETTWKSTVQDAPCDFHFLDEAFDRLYHAEKVTGTAFKYFSVLAVLISCLGLLGLIAHDTVQRTREIGIRKALGASTTGVVVLLSGELFRAVLIANLAAWPIAYYAMHRWLQNFAYRTPIDWRLFILSGGLSLLIALLTVGYLAVKSARANPIEALRYE
jgi:putative ABC transport system permease protein